MSPMYRYSIFRSTIVILAATLCGCETKMDYDSLKLVPTASFTEI